MSAEHLIALLFSAALLVALGFHRHRAAQFALLLLILSLAMSSGSARWQEGAQRFLPLFALASAVLPEGRLWSRRHALWLALLALLLGTTLDAPERLFHSMANAAAWPFGHWSAQHSAALFLGLAGGVGLGRWWLQRQPMELGSTLALAAAALAMLWPASAAGLLLGSALALLLAALYASYRMAFVDQLTGLPNRRALDETLGRLSGDYRLAMLDIDHFKSFNDSHGHDAGDVVLREVARQLARSAGGKAFRYGGEEFCVVYPGAADERAALGLEQARASIEQRRIEIASGGKKSRDGKGKRTEVAVTISAGCAARERDRRSAPEVLKAADQALYRAKKKGRNRVVMA